MSDNVSNSDIFNALMDLKGDIGGLKTSNDLFVKGLENHSTRLGVLEEGAAKQRGAAKVWTLVGTAIGSTLGAGAAIFTAWVKH